MCVCAYVVGVRVYIIYIYMCCPPLEVITQVLPELWFLARLGVTNALSL